ncbi:MAG: thiazole synthase [Planctomycetes bacterium]|nr:thiazole synthase [Planctomycetota bacterium]
MTATDPLTVGPYTFGSRVMLGTGKYSTLDLMDEALAASGTEVVTVAVRRVKFGEQDGPDILSRLQGKYTLLPNTAGCFTADEAVRTAQLAREILDTPLVKLEVIGCTKTLFPDVPGTLEAAKQLIKDGFVVLPYITDDPVSCQRLQDMGCPAVMPLAAPIGSGMGIQNPANLRILIELMQVPVIVDAGVGTASDVTRVFELGADAVLLNTGVAAARDPVAMATAVKHAAIAGRLAAGAGRMPRKLYATASSPLEGLIQP